MCQVGQQNSVGGCVIPNRGKQQELQQPGPEAVQIRATAEGLDEGLRYTNFSVAVLRSGLLAVHSCLLGSVWGVFNFMGSYPAGETAIETVNLSSSSELSVGFRTLCPVLCRAGYAGEPAMTSCVEFLTKVRSSANSTV